MPSLSEYQRDALAQMVVAGIPRQTIAQSLRVHPDTVSRLLNEDEDVKARIDAAQASVIRTLAVHHAEMLDMLDDVRASIRDGLRSTDLRLRVETARWMHERLMPQEPREQKLKVTAEVSHEISGTLESMLTHVAEIKAVTSGGSGYLARVRSGPSALPGVTVIPSQVPSSTEVDDTSREDYETRPEHFDELRAADRR